MSPAKKAPAKPRTKKAEVWVSVPGSWGLYEVSDEGRVRSLQRQTATGILGGKVLTPQCDRRGYQRVTFSVNGKATRYLVHRLVLSAFRGDSHLETRHLNGCADDNRLANLAWGTRAENAADRILHCTQYDNRGERHGNAKLTDDQASAILIQAQSGAPQTSLATQFKVSLPTINRIVRGHGWTHVQEAVNG